MKKQSMVLAAAIALCALGLAGCAGQTSENTASTNANLNMPSPTPDKAAIEAELTRIENDWPRVLKEHDSAAVQRVEADDVILIYPDGSLGTKQRDVEDIGSGALTADAWEVSEVHVNILDNDSAVVSLRNNVINGKYKTPNGKSENVSGQFRFVDTFARRNGQWQLVASVGVPIANPTAPAAKASPAGTPITSPSPATKSTPPVRPSPARKVATPTATP